MKHQQQRGKFAQTGRRTETGGLWRGLEEDARCAVLIGASEGRPLDPEGIARAIMHVYRTLPHAKQLTEQLSQRVAEIIDDRSARAS